MSLSAYDIYMRLNGLDDDDGSSREAAISSRDRERDVESPSLESPGTLSLDDSLSLNSSFLQEHSFTITVPPGILGTERSDSSHSGDHGERTIISSNPSGASIPPQLEASRSIFAVSPHPRLTVDGFHSMSTTNTELHSFENIYGDRTRGEESSNEDEAGSESDASATLMSIGEPSNSHRLPSAFFEDETVARIASTSIATDDTEGNLPFGSESDRFTDMAREILPILSSGIESPCLPPLPPSLPSKPTPTPQQWNCTYNAKDHLPPAFVCGVCKDVIVGACILNCSCTVCASCFEELELSSKQCPSCEAVAEFQAYCHALDVAILRIVQALPEPSDDVSHLKQNYYWRLSQWRDIVILRNDLHTRQKTIQNDELLARLIEEEERVLWEIRRSRSGTKDKETFLKRISSVFGKVVIAGTVAIAMPLAIAIPLIAMSLKRKSRPNP